MNFAAHARTNKHICRRVDFDHRTHIALAFDQPGCCVLGTQADAQAGRFVKSSI